MHIRLLLLLPSLLFSSTCVSAATKKPNVILIMADDVSWECFGCYGSDEYSTPNIDKLAAEGLRFDHCYSTPICTPSRVKIMTGKYSFRNYTHFGYLNPAERTFGQMMQDAGYKTAIAGKWQLNGLYSKNEGCFDGKRPLKAGFDETLLWQVLKGKREAGGGERFWEAPLEKNGEMLPLAEGKGTYGPDELTDFVCDFVTRHKDEPFFVYYPMVLVHDPFVVTPDSRGELAISRELNKQPKDKKQMKQNFVDMVAYMDKLVGRITNHVDKLGLAEDTIIMFTADNGTHKNLSSIWNGQTIQGGKGQTKDSGTHVPFVARWKGKTPAGTATNDLVDFTDFYATIKQAAQAKPHAADPVDGVSFLPQLKGEEGQKRKWALCHYQPYWGSHKAGQFARTATYKLYRDGSFYNVPVDLDEQKNLKDLGEEAATIKKELAHLLRHCPEVPAKGGKKATKRPVHPDWPNLHQRAAGPSYPVR